AQFHLAEQTFTLHLFLERAQSLIDVIIAYDDLYDGNHPFPNQISDDGCFPSGGLLCNTARIRKQSIKRHKAARQRPATPAAAQHTDFSCYFFKNSRIIAIKRGKLSCSDLPATLV